MSSARLNIMRPISWPHHNGGWRWVVELLTEQLHDPNGIRCVTAVEEEFYFHGPIQEPWVGFVHQVPKHDERPAQMTAWRASLPHCRGLWVLSEYVRSALHNLGITVPIGLVRYPAPTPTTYWTLEAMRTGPREVHFIGTFLRNYQSFYDLDAGDRRKILFAPQGFDPQALGIADNGSVEARDRVDSATYERTLARSIVFLNLVDAFANTTVVECLARATPLIVNRLTGVEEYVGADYPLFYDTLDEAAALLRDEASLVAGSRHLAALPIQEEITGSAFLENLQRTAIYRDLSIPPKQLGSFRPRDVTVMMCSYRRTNTLSAVVERFTRQDFDGSFEFVLWNNNAESTQDVDRIAARFDNDLDLRVIHSSANLFCRVRLAMPAIMRSDVLVVCDDDVLVEPCYLRELVAAHKRHGDEALCFRGHRFLPHALDEDHPERVWIGHESLVFSDESEPEQLVHFMHADNCLLPRSILARIGAYPMRRLETALVDDYWMSFVLSHHLNVPIRKLRGDHCFSFLPSADDPEVALFRNEAVAQERIRFYVSHMRQGWPNWDAATTSSAHASSDTNDHRR
ncbi:glycosyltransferase [Mycobacterium gastri]|uniref:Glycosyltransferase 2-like domain-containing protein n=1 Tax=Mycobacterium gastri TaxID=1777 RepID=A0A1X1VXF2_MYCGS|nr:glycosyltransferase [Mycobacterium gastri]ETW23523.1 hypothetical protein MGAST_13695 [Mycobacterium gastri 'Wayne']ORV74587.1 hypothetical protein AWC07_25140 [Mycobacterium gastri]